jgi:hypothetical protein
VPSSVVADGGSRLESVELESDDVHLLFTLSRLIDVGDVCGVVLVVVDLHGGSIDVGFKGLEWIIQIGHSVGVGSRWYRDGSSNGRTLLQDFSAKIGPLFPDRCRFASDVGMRKRSSHKRHHNIALPYSQLFVVADRRRNSRAFMVMEKADAEPTTKADITKDSLDMVWC